MAERNRNVLIESSPSHRYPAAAHGALRALLGFFLACASLVPRAAFADDNKMLILPTVVTRAKECEPEPKATPRVDPATLVLARQVDTLLSDSVQDLDLSLEIAPPTRAADEERSTPVSDEALTKLADSRWVVAPSLVVDGRHLQLRLVAVAPGSRVLAVRTQEVEPQNIDVRAVVMLGELVRSQSRTPQTDSRREFEQEPRGQSATPVRSEGRGVLAISSALLGGFTGYSLQRAGGSSDARVTYPLTALGAGIGLGASMLVADEWDVTLDDSWILAAGIGWPSASGYFLAKGYDAQPTTDRYIYTLAGAGVGLTLASASISLHRSTPGGAIMVHSGGVFGTFLGALTEWTRYGRTDYSPNKGMGWGAGIGVLAAGVVATQIDASSTRVLFIDLAASLGALSGAALASPLLFVEKGDLPLNRNRAWLAAVGTGTLIGGGIGWLATRNMAPATPSRKTTVSYMPFFNLTSDPTVSNPAATRGWVAGVSGTW